MTTRSSGKIAFVVVRDGTGYLQAVVSQKEVPETTWQALATLTQETSVEVTGAVRPILSLGPALSITLTILSTGHGSLLRSCST